MIINQINEMPLFSSTSRHIGNDAVQGTDNWAVIMAGGDGTRLRSLTRGIAGDDRPKQFCRILGDDTLLDQTRRRVGLSVAPARTMFAVTQTHESFYESGLSRISAKQLIEQPKNAGTAPAILYALLRVAKHDPAASVAFFPSDHYVSDDEAFMSYVDEAFKITKERRDLVILLGIKPDGPEEEYGWIEPVSSELIQNPDALGWVRRFWEKPTIEQADKLMSRGCLWNSFVMVGTVSAFLKMIQRAVPDLYERFSLVQPHLNTFAERENIENLYSRLAAINFSKDVLAARPTDLAVLPVSGLIWRDLGKPQRVLSTLAHIRVNLTEKPRVFNDALLGQYELSA